MDFNILATILGGIAGCITLAGSLVWWLASQFRLTRDLIYSRVQEVIEKLEYHERHDDERFQSVRNDIWEIRLRNARIDGKKIGREEDGRRVHKTDI